MLKRRLKALLKALLVLFVLLAAFLLFDRVRGQIALARYKRELIAQGEKLSPQDFVQSFAEADNGAPEVISATEQLKRGTVLPLSRAPVMKLVPSGRALVGFREPEWIDAVTYRDGEWLDEKVTNRWDQLAADLEANALVFREIRAALEKPVLNNKVDLSKGMNLNVQHLSPPKRLSQWFGPASQLALHEERTHNALGYLLLQVRLLSFLAEDHLVISELVRIALAGIARVHTWEALQADPWTDEDLAELQRAWEHQSFSSALARALEGERVNWYVLIEIGRQSNQNAAALFGLETDCPNDPSAVLAWEKLKANRTFGKKVADLIKKLVCCPLWRFAWAHQDQRRSLERLQRFISILRDASAHKSYLEALPQVDRFRASLQSRNPYDTLRFPASAEFLSTLPRLVARAMRAETDRSLTICAIALKRYAVRHGEYPTKLDDLVPDFLTVVPIYYMGGKPVKYRVNSDGSFTLYSVGEDGKDDGGDLSPSGEKATRNLWKRHDYVWPSPALPEEVEAYRKEAAEN